MTYIRNAAEVTSGYKLIYAHDPLCGWCYGIVPALRRFAVTHPHVQIEVAPGGLFTGTPARPYASLISHIRTAEVHLERVTGRKPTEAFHAFIAQDKQIDACSERPSHAILQVQAQAPFKAVEFAHRLQELHYETGADLNEAEVYDRVTSEMNLPDLDTKRIVNASLADPLISEAYERCARLKPQGYPTVFVATLAGRVAGSIPSTYEPDAFVQRVDTVAATISPKQKLLPE